MDLRIAALNRGPNHALYQNESGDFYISYIKDGMAVFQPFDDFKVSEPENVYGGLAFDDEMDYDYALFSGLNSPDSFFAYESGSFVHLYSGDSEIASFSGGNPVFVIFINKSGANDYLRLHYTRGDDLRYREQSDGFLSSKIASSGGQFANSQYLALLGEVFEPFRASILYKREGRFFEAYSEQDINIIQGYYNDFSDTLSGNDFDVKIFNSFKDAVFVSAQFYYDDLTNSDSGILYEDNFFTSGDHLIGEIAGDNFVDLYNDYFYEGTGLLVSGNEYPFTGYSRRLIEKEQFYRIEDYG